MSLAGPHGEAACRYCNTLVDLDENRRLVRHPTRGTCFPCRGSSTYAHTQQRENEDLAFSAEPVMQDCPTCGQSVVINTSVRRYSHHQAPTGGDCTQSGKLVPGARTVEVEVKPF